MSRTPLLLGAATLALSLVSADPVSEGYDLSPKFKEGQSLTVRNDITVAFGLDDASAYMGDMEVLPEVPTVDIEVEVASELSEEIMSVTKEGAITKMRRTHEEDSVIVTGEAGAMGEFQEINESEEGPMQGRTIELTKSEEGWKVEDVSEDMDDPDEMVEMMIALSNERTHFEQMLPSRPVEVGSTWDMGDAMFEEMERVMQAMSAQESEMSQVMGIVESLRDQMEFEATGKLVSVDDGTAKLEWKMTAELVIDDLFGLLREALPPELLEEMPESAEGNIEFVVELEGGGTFDLRNHMLTDASMEGEFAISGAFAMSEQGMEIEASADASGSFEIESSITIE